MTKTLFFFLFLISIEAHAQRKAGASFRFHQSNEPLSLNPQEIRSASNQFLLQNLHRNLLKLDGELNLVPDLAESCVRGGSQKEITCRLKKDLKWSDGRPLTARDFLKSYQELLDPANKRPRADLLFAVEGAENLFRTGHGSLGVQVQGLDTLKFRLSRPDPEFEYTLAALQLAPWRDKAFSGPYRMDKWVKGEKIVLAPNPHYPSGNERRPPVEILFIEDEGVALKLYEKNELDFLRRLPTLYIGKHRSRPDFHWIPLARLDYLGFGERLKNQPELRKALALSLDYPELRKLFQAEGLPGCTGLPPAWMGSAKPLCYTFDPKQARDALAKVPAENRGPLNFIYSNAGGEDHRRAAEWEQGQWKKNLKVDVRVRGIENKLFLSEMETARPDLFRRGVSADRPTCRAFLATFRPDHPDNVLKPGSKKLQTALDKLLTAKNKPEEERLCHQALSALLESFELIPLGPIHFAVLARGSFTGWSLNALSTLDLSGLQARP